jgi:hypothetical protein
MHFDGRRFYNPGAPQARGLLDVLRWKLRSRPEPSPAFISDAAVHEGWRITNHTGEPLDRPHSATQI